MKTVDFRRSEDRTRYGLTVSIIHHKTIDGRTSTPDDVHTQSPGALRERTVYNAAYDWLVPIVMRCMCIIPISIDRNPVLRRVLFDLHTHRSHPCSSKRPEKRTRINADTVFLGFFFPETLKFENASIAFTGRC